LISEIKVELNSAADSRSPGQRQIALLALSPSWRAYVSAAPAHTVPATAVRIFPVVIRENSRQVPARRKRQVQCKRGTALDQ